MQAHNCVGSRNNALKAMIMLATAPIRPNTKLNKTIT